MSGFLVISTASDLLRVRHDSIVYISSDGNYSQLLLPGGEMRLLTMQLGQVEKLIDNQLDIHRHNFIRIGKSLIINRNYIFYIHINRQQLVLKDNDGNQYTIQASKEALRQLKTLIETENERN
ncbi:MAG: LytTR family transcriptional regulator DNA-binding domain-containing protein [Muribaculaceae bacterium]|nr:LytTR family transcriptional regulator DNA-binding domain-containing protein [Muribaculaceae bacterium]